jgi:hypothetical protein
MYTPVAVVDGVQLTDSAATYYTVATTSKLVLKSAVFTNDDTSFVTVSINIVPYSGSADYTNRIIKNKPIPPGESWVCSEMINMVIGRGGFISMSASVANKVGCRISGYEVT